MYFNQYFIVGFFFFHKQERMIHLTYDQAIASIMTDVDSGSKEPFIIYREINGDWNVSFVYEQLHNKNDLYNYIKTIDPFALMHTGKDFSMGSFSYVYDTVICNRIRSEWNLNKTGDYRTSYYISLEQRDTEALINLFEDNAGDFSNYVMNYLSSVEKPLSELAKLCPYRLYTYDKDFSYNIRLANKAIDKIEFHVYKKNYLNKVRTNIHKPAPKTKVKPLSLIHKLNKAKDKADMAAETQTDYNNRNINKAEVR